MLRHQSIIEDRRLAILAQEERAVESEMAKNELIKVSASANEDTFDHVK